jgi:hypothetical protein
MRATTAATTSVLGNPDATIKRGLQPSSGRGSSG